MIFFIFIYIKLLCVEYKGFMNDFSLSGYAAKILFI